MRILIIQENGRHLANRAFRECFSLAWAMGELGHEAVVWGLGHANFGQRPKFSAFDAILNLENYDQNGWLPNSGAEKGPIKLLWAIDEHCRDREYYQRLFERDGCHYWLHSTRDYVEQNARHVWMPNAFDHRLIKPLHVAKRAQVGFCGSLLNRQPLLDLLEKNFEFVKDIGVLGQGMVEAINSYGVAFNCNVANDINGRSFEVLGCGVPLVTNFNPQYLDLGFKHRENCVFYDSPERLLEGIGWLLENEDRRRAIGARGCELSRHHTFLARARQIIELIESRRSAPTAIADSVQRSEGQPHKSCKVSIGIITNAGLPSQNRRAEFLQRLLRSVSVAGFPAGEHEVLVAGAIPAGLKGIKPLSCPELAGVGQVSKMRNLLIQSATGQYLVLCDDDILFTPGYWEAVSKQLEGPVDVLCAKLLNPNGTRYWDWAAYVPGRGQTLLPYEVQMPFVYATGGHAIYKAQIFEKISWNENLKHGDNEEFDLAEQARTHSLNFGFCAQATVYLQYHHCDAAAVIADNPQKPEMPVCSQYADLLEALATKDKRSLKTGKSVYDRFAFKVVQAPNTDSVEAPTISILIACHRYLQRFSQFARSICNQNYDLEKVEVVVANPESADGLASYLATLNKATAGKGPQFIECKCAPEYFRNRGYLIQQAFKTSSGQVIIGMDCDLVLPQTFLQCIVSAIKANPNAVVGVYRRFLNEETTARIISGLIDPIDQFETKDWEDEQEAQGYRGVLGYCQALDRVHWEAIGYPVEFDNIAKSDIAFVERLAARGVKPLFLREVEVLHLNHPRNWEGTTEFL